MNRSCFRAPRSSCFALCKKPSATWRNMRKRLGSPWGWTSIPNASGSPSGTTVWDLTWTPCCVIPTNGITSGFAESWSGLDSWAVKARSSLRKGVARQSSSTSPWPKRRRYTMEKIKVLIADDHRIVGEDQDGMEAVEKVKTLVPDVVLMDVSMPRMGGVEATRQIKREFPHIGVVALTMYDEQQYIFDLVRAGATGYLLKDSESSQIVAAIRAIYKGESLIHPSVASKILAEFSLMSQKRGKKPGWVEHDLTEREITVLRLVADGKTNKEIANNLDLSEKTVKNHVRNIFHKLQVYDRTQAAILAIRKGLIELDPRP